ncbi:MAG: calcium/sodium antiporter [Muribaculaceae bacterium]|nr:calcium/sodium antiporter [Muribaculaceae bacterium]
MNILFLILGLVLILVGANMLTDGATSVARRWGMSDLMVGLTIVAFGTSAPELVISVTSAAADNPGIAVGNVVGSNIFNIFAIIGITALVRPIVVERSVLTTDIPLVVLSSIALLAIGLSIPLDNTDPVVTRVDGVLLLLFFAIFMRHTFSTAEEMPADEKASDPSAVEAARQTIMPLWKGILWTVLGLAALIWGGDMFVDGASGVASSLGVSDAVIGLTIVAMGTSLPELATSVTAAVKGNQGIAIGNVIGSNVFNIFLVLGCSALVRPLPFAGITPFDLLTLTVASVLFWLFAKVYKVRTITRAEGALLTLCYAGYVAIRLMTL